MYRWWVIYVWLPIGKIYLFVGLPVFTTVQVINDSHIRFFGFSIEVSMTKCWWSSVVKSSLKSRRFRSSISSLHIDLITSLLNSVLSFHLRTTKIYYLSIIYRDNLKTMSSSSSKPPFRLTEDALKSLEEKKHSNNSINNSNSNW